MLVEVDRVCPETLPQPPRSSWYHFLSQSHNYFRYTAAIMEFLHEGNVGQSRHIHQWILYPKHRYSQRSRRYLFPLLTAKLLVLPVLVTVSTSGLHRIVLCLVGQCPCWCRWIGRALKHCHSRWDHLAMIFCRKVITTFGIRRPSWNFWGKEMSGKVDIYTSENFTPKHTYSHWDRVDICC